MKEFTEEEVKKMTANERLFHIQQEIKVPKAQFNKFGNFYYRSCEDILEAVKPYLAKYRATLRVDDKPELIKDNIYIKASAVFVNLDKDGDIIINSAYARESNDKKGMDDSQLTGTASSYARKYALNGLLLLDDTKDADTDEFGKQTGKEITDKKVILLTENQKKMIEDLYKDDVNELIKKLNSLKKKKVAELTIKEASDIIKSKKGE